MPNSPLAKPPSLAVAHRLLATAAAAVVSLVVGFVIVSGPDQAASWTTFMQRMVQTPDVTQTRVGIRLPNRGRAYCAPVAVANSLAWLGRKGIWSLPGEKGRFGPMVAELGNLMGTDPDGGTSPLKLIRGVRSFLLRHAATDADFAISRQGWRECGPTAPAVGCYPDKTWLAANSEGLGVVWLLVGWYRYDPTKAVYLRSGGHWLTMIGCGMDSSGTPDPDTLIVHNPSPGAGRVGLSQALRLEALSSGTLIGRYSGLPRPAAGYYRVRGLGSDVRLAILDDAVALRPVVRER
jgi:hypothetical protein